MGHHHFKDVWSPIVGEVLQCYREENNRYDRNAIGVYKRQGVQSTLLVGRVPRELSSEFARALDRGRSITCTIAGQRENRRGRGLEVPCTYSLL